ncbi:PREDICTED: odorant receptor Or1 [Dinoponera quadriceps]|uniref:Odorant receptor n=1 Tax=Dinoponera quadriceps TaxID=609295 RepID=A0A6P3X5M5_DINQU|nr:PREDICTED: odorant receptor Or1 [Dinoponera quadriceps]
MSSDYKVTILQKERGKAIAPNFHLQVSLSIVHFLGTWPPRTGKYRFLYLLYTTGIFTLMLGIFLVTEIANMLVNLGDTAKIVAGATLLMTNCIHASKVIVLLRHQARIQALLDKANSHAFHRQDEAHQDLLTSYTWKGLFHHAAYQSFGATAVFCWGFTPIADLIAGRSRRLPMEGWYPYNVTGTPAFEITAGHQGVAIIIACFHNVAMDTLITGLITVACCQLAILERNISAIDDEKSGMNNFKGEVTQETCPPYQRLKWSIRLLISRIRSFVREIQDIFGTVIFLQFLSNCVIICLIAFNVSQMKEYIPAVLIGMLTYMCCMTYQIFIFCWHGNELHLHSLRIATAAYSSKWFSETGRFKRGLLIIMTRAHRPFILTAGNIMLLSLDTFVQVRRKNRGCTTAAIFTVPSLDIIVDISYPNLKIKLTIFRPWIIQNARSEETSKYLRDEANNFRVFQILRTSYSIFTVLQSSAA